MLVVIFHRVDVNRLKLPVAGLGGVGPAPRVGEMVELRLADLLARLAKEHVVIGVRVKWWIEINEIDARIGKFFPIG